MNWLVLAGSLVAILALAGIARLLRLGRDGKVEDAGAAAQAAEDALAGFRAEGALVSDDDLAAIVAGARKSVVSGKSVSVSVELGGSRIIKTHKIVARDRCREYVTTYYTYTEP